MLAMDEHGGHEDLRGSGRWSVTHYVHGESYYIAQAWACECVPESKFAYHLPHTFINQAHGNYIVT
jgi:hypothetical protein